jgi:hypothetical protein
MFEGIATERRAGGSMARRFFLVLALAFVSTACGTLPLSEPAPTGWLVVENPEGLVVELERVGGARVTLGEGRRIRIRLEAGRYVLHTGAHSYPAPLLPRLIEGGELVVCVAAPPEAVSGFVFVPGGPTLIGDVLGVGAVDERPRSGSLPHVDSSRLPAA